MSRIDKELHGILEPRLLKLVKPKIHKLIKRAYHFREIYLEAGKEVNHKMTCNEFFEDEFGIKSTK